MGYTKIFAEAQKLWMKINLRGMITASLSLQVFLIFVAPIRKRFSTRWIMILTWSAYLVADWVADYAFGIISKAQLPDDSSKSKADAYGDLLAFWAPFLLLHLGGPDTITAFALEDNELWRRHLLNLFFQLGAAGYVFYQSLPSNKLIFPTILMFIGGITKYIERTRALYLASFSKFRASLLTSPDPGPNYAKLMEEYDSKKKAHIPASVKMIPELHNESTDDEKKEHNEATDDELDEREVIEKAFLYFKTFRGLLVDLIFSFRERHESRKYFSNISAKDAFRVIEAELNFFYDVLHTKAAVVHCRIGYIFRAISIGSLVTAFAFFYVLNKNDFHEYDIQITYTLLLGAVSLEFVALCMLIRSDWTIAFLVRSEKRHRCPSIVSTFISVLLKLKSQCSLFGLYTLNRRWSKTIFQYNLIDSRLKKWPKYIEKFLGLISLQEFFDDFMSGKTIPYREGLDELIFGQLKKKSSSSKDSESIKEMCAARGKWVLEETKKGPRDCTKLLPYVSDVDYGESLLLWHIATELCYNTLPPNSVDTDESTKKHRENSKVLSDYMLHLMINQPNMMSAVAGIGQIRFRDTCAELDKFISENSSDGSRTGMTQKDVCESLLCVPTEVRPADVKGDRSKSALFDAVILAKAIKSSGRIDWEIVSEVWVELLAYAAIRCRPYNHAQQLSKGGELITLVWLLMVQLGLSEQFQIVEGHARAKLIVEK